MQAAETEAQQMHQEALASSPAVAEPQAAPSTSLAPQAPAQTPAPPATTAVAAAAILPSARLLFRAQVAKAKALVACAAALQNQQEGSASYALPGKDAAIVKQFLAQAGMLVHPHPMHLAPLCLPVVLACCSIEACTYADLLFVRLSMSVCQHVCLSAYACCANNLTHFMDQSSSHPLAECAGARLGPRLL